MMLDIRDEIPLALARHGYEATARLRERYGDADWFQARMLGRRALVVRGPEGVEAFYDRSTVTRHGAVPAPLRLLLFGPGAVHGLDGEAHLQRKQLFFDVVTPACVARLAAQVDERLSRATQEWTRSTEVRLFDRLVEVYGASVIAWAGIDVDAEESKRMSHELALVVDGFGVRGTAYPRAVLARARTELWARRLVRDVRTGDRAAPDGSALAVMAAADLSATTAATELLNVLRPTVAVAFFGAFTAHALEARPDWRRRLAAGTDDERRAFEHEVRRWYPFAPLLAGRLRRPLPWAGGEMRTGDFIVLDIVGTNRHPATWEEPDEFRPERFLDAAGRVVEPGIHDYVPHGGGDVRTGHRCPGEPSAAALLEVTLRHLAALALDLADEAREVPLRRIPSRPAHGTTLRARQAT